MRRVVAYALAVVALAGACTRGDTTTVTATGAAAASSPTAVLTDHVAAQRVLVTATDLPGYDALPAGDAQASSMKGAVTFESCAGAAATLGDPQRTALSPAFMKGSTNAVSSLAIVAANEGDAQTAMASLARADLAGCVTTLFRTVLDLDLLPGTTAKTEAQSIPKVSDQSVMWRTTLQVALGTQTIPAYADLTFFRSGRTVASLFNFQVGEPSKLLAAMAART
jgi:hypothetical protein